ncbi:unnamed protein product [Prunus brigantina]
MLSQTLYYITTFQKTLSHIYEANLRRAVHRTCLGHHLRRAVQVTELAALDLPRGPKSEDLLNPSVPMALRLRDSHGARQGRGTEKINLTDPWLRKFPFEAPQSRTSMQVFMKAGFGKSELSFMNKIFHPNVDELSGSVYLDVINQSWSPMFGNYECALYALTL